MNEEKRIFINAADPDIVLVLGSGNKVTEINISEVLENATRKKKEETFDIEA